MFDEFSLNRFLRGFYPAAVFLFTVLAWNAAGQANIDFNHPRKLNSPIWRGPAVLQPPCDTNRLHFQVAGSCRTDDGHSQIQVQTKVDATEASSASSYR